MRQVLLAAAVLAAAVPSAWAGGRSGDFDFYVVSLSWSPSWCEAENVDDGLQCDGRRPYAFVLHGLWPQYERGFPDYCWGGPEGGPTRADIGRLLAIMPAPGLIRHEWEKHGTCSGLGVESYVELMEDAYARITVPVAYRHIESYLTVTPREVEAAFLAANPDMEADGIAATCDARRLREVRICMTKDLDFRPCPEIDRRDCRSSRVTMPPVR